MKIGFVAPSSAIPLVEFQIGVEKLRDVGLAVQVHPQCKKRHRFFAGTDQERAEAFLEYAYSDEIDVIWCARGGTGAARLLPLLAEQAEKRGAPRPKLLVGFSDVTALADFTRERWNWHTLHAGMPGTPEFTLKRNAEMNTLVNWVSKKFSPSVWGKKKLKAVRATPEKLRAPLVGGNLKVWGSLLGTPYWVSPKNCLLFLEDVTEGPHRLDRQVVQLHQAGAFNGVKACLLGEFVACEDQVQMVLKKKPKGTRSLKKPKPSELKPLRPKIKLEKSLADTFGELGIPVYAGLPVGHGFNNAPLALGGAYELTPDGGFELISWSWFE